MDASSRAPSQVHRTVKEAVGGGVSPHECYFFVDLPEGCNAMPGTSQGSRGWRRHSPKCRQQGRQMTSPSADDHSLSPTKVQS